MSFSSLGLSAPLLRAIAARGYVTPTPVQSAALRTILSGRDVWACAQTGSGKTAAFVLPILEQLATSKIDARRTGVLILAPTRELAAQIGETIRSFSEFLARPVKTVIAFGGVSINPQMMSLRGGADIVVATPGRLLDLVDHNALSLGHVTTLVLDEADRLLDLGFSEELNRLLGLLPKKRQTLFFSATFPPAVHALAESLLINPERIDVPSSPTTKPDILQRAIEVDVPQRTQLLRHLIVENNWTRVLVFVATKYSSDHVADKLCRAGIEAASFHGELSQGSRTRALADFKAGAVKVLVATDVAARGIDIAAMPVVVNYDLPRSPMDYIHRIGRTGRAGESGMAVSFVSAATHAHFQLIEKRQGAEVPREQVAGFEPQDLDVPLPQAGGVKGRRKSKKDKLREAAAGKSQTPAPVRDKPTGELAESVSWARRVGTRLR